MIQPTLSKIELFKAKTAVLVYRDCLLPYSETFIWAQTSHLQQYQPWYVGTTTANGLDRQISPEHCLVLENTVQLPAFWKMGYKLGGLVPGAWLGAIRAAQPRLLHVHFGFDAGFAQALARKLGLPWVITGHGYDVTLDADPAQLQSWGQHKWDFLTHRGRFFRERYLRQRAQIFQSANGVIAVSEFIRQRLITMGCAADKVITHHVGIDVDQFCPDSQVLREPIILFVGRLVEKKGCRYLIEAMARVQKTLPEAQLVIIGDGAQRPKLTALAEDLGVSAAFLGQRPIEEVRQWLNRSAVFSVPSVVAAAGDAEGLGMVFLEAQAMELPVVSSRSGGIPEAVIHGETGFLAPERDVLALSHYLLTLLQQPELRSQFGQAGRRHVCQKFNLKHQTAQLEQLYDRLLKTGSVASLSSAQD